MWWYSPSTFLDVFREQTVPSLSQRFTAICHKWCRSFNLSQWIIHIMGWGDIWNTRKMLVRNIMAIVLSWNSIIVASQPNSNLNCLIIVHFEHRKPNLLWSNVSKPKGNTLKMTFYLFGRYKQQKYVCLHCNPSNPPKLDSISYWQLWAIYIKYSEKNQHKYFKVQVPPKAYHVMTIVLRLVLILLLF